MSIADCLHLTIKGNQIHDHVSDGIRLERCSKLNIIGNTIEGTARGIRSTDTETVPSINVVVIGNTILDTPGYGVRSEGNADYWLVANNILRGNTTGNISLVGANNLVVNNIE